MPDTGKPTLEKKQSWRVRFNAVGVSTVVADGVQAVATRTYRTAFYARLSVEFKMKPSDSIANQLAIMRDFTKDKAEFTDTFEYIDNGVSGTSFDRPAFQQMMEDARAGKINCIIVKDLSRFGRTFRLVERNGKMKRQYFYQCRYSYDAGGNKKCVGSWLETDLIRLVYDALSFQIAMQYEKAEAMVDEMNEMIAKTLAAFDHKTKSLEKGIEKIDYSESKSYEVYVLGEMSKQELFWLQQKNAKEIADLRGQIFDETENKTREKKKLEKEIRWWSAVSCMRGKASLSREIIEAMISRIELHPDKNIRTTYNFKDPLAEEREKYRREHAKNGPDSNLYEIIKGR